MESRRVAVFEICVGILLIVIGFILWRWSKQILWILIYPPPLAKPLIESLPFLFWGLGALLVVDGVRRKIQDTRMQMHAKQSRLRNSGRGEVAIRKDKLLLFGKFYDVEVYKSEKYAISLDDRKIRIRMPGSGKPRSREYEYLRKWIRGELLKTLTNFLREYERVMKAPIGKFYIKNQKTRWASYSQKRNIHFNIKLAALPKRIIEYIVIHELAHATQPNHSRKFWYIVEKSCPDYKKRKQELKEYSLVIQKSKIWQKMLNMYT